MSALFDGITMRSVVQSYMREGHSEGTAIQFARMWRARMERLRQKRLAEIAEQKSQKLAARPAGD